MCGITPFFFALMKQEFTSFQTILRTHTRFILTTHVSPDGDGLGSELALAQYLDSSGKEVSILNHSPTPVTYEFLDPSRQITHFDPTRHTRVIAEADVIVVLDTNHPDRLGEMKNPVLSSRAKKVVIDHHLDADPFADLLILDERSAATGQIVFKLLEFLKGPALSPDTAQALYVALMTDTGSFRFPKTDAEVHRVTASLIERGADPVAAYQAIYEQSSQGKIQLLGRALASLKTAHHGALVYLTVTQKMFQETKTSEPDVDQFAPYTLSLKNVRIGLVFTELADQVKVSFRSKGDIPINKLAQEFGGNGHKNAAGARVMNGVLNEVVTNVIDRAAHYLES